jgi:hypothetical protein
LWPQISDIPASEHKISLVAQGGFDYYQAI